MHSEPGFLKKDQIEGSDSLAFTLESEAPRVWKVQAFLLVVGRGRSQSRSVV